MLFHSLLASLLLISKSRSTFSKQTCLPRSFVLYQLQTFPFFIFLSFRSLNFAGVGARKEISKKDRFHGNGPYCKIPTEN